MADIENDNETQTEQQPIGTLLNDEPAGADVQPATNEQQPDNSSWTLRAYHDEKAKRQSLAKRVQELEEERAQWNQHTEQSTREQFWAEPEKQFAQMQDQIRETNVRASRVEALSTHGKDQFDAMQAAIEHAMSRGDADMALLREACLASNDPYRVAMEWYASTQGGKAGEQGSLPSPAFPTNLGNARNVQSRTKSTWSGPPSLDDIFDELGK